jgi:putative transcriptional regulator
MMFHAGRLLVATPLLVDPNFDRAVVLIVEHDAENGAFGLVLNRPTPAPVGEILDAWHDAAAEPKVVFVGGPVQRDVAVGLARTSDVERRVVMGATSMVDLGSTPELEGAAFEVRVFSGYSGWDAGQLEAEIDEGAWFVVDAEAGDASTPHPEGLWRRVLARQKSPMSVYSTYTGDPDEN